jgi:hypothetical protein
MTTLFVVILLIYLFMTYVTDSCELIPTNSSGGPTTMAFWWSMETVSVLHL